VGIYKSFTEHMNVEVGTVAARAIPFLGIYVSNFRYWFFAVWVSADKVKGRKECYVEVGLFYYCMVNTTV
jgi:hypothetical protein